MAIETKTRLLTQNRVKRHRQKGLGTPCNRNVTFPLSYSSSISEENTTTTARARSVTSASQEIVKTWNAAVPQAQQVPADGTPAIDRACSSLLTAAPPVSESEILEAIGNYRLALKVPNSQAYAHSLGQFLRRETIERYLPGVFNLTNYDRRNFGRGEQQSESPEDTVKRLTEKGLL
jgi:hypothetical protein